MMPVDDDARCGTLLGRQPIIEKGILFEHVPVRPHRFGFVAEEEADTFILRDAVAAEEVVAVFVADGDADAFVAAQLVVLEPAVLHAPTHVEAVAAVADRPALADERPRRSAAWV